MSIRSDGHVAVVKERYLLVKSHSGYIYVPKSICPLEFALGDAVSVCADIWEYKRLPAELQGYNIRYRATVINRNEEFEEHITEEGSVSHILHNNGFLIRFGKDEVYCPQELVVGTTGIQETDIIKFNARKWDNPPIYLEEIGVRYKCTSLEYHNKAKVELATGTFASIEDNGRFGIAEGRLNDGTVIFAQVDVGVVKPSCIDLRKMFPNAEPVKFKAIEQGANRKNGNMKWKVLIATDERYLINEDNSITIDPFFADFEEEESYEEAEADSSATDEPSVSYEAPVTTLQNATNSVTHSHTAAPCIESSLIKEAMSLNHHDHASPVAYDPNELQEKANYLQFLAHYLADSVPTKIN